MGSLWERKRAWANAQSTTTLSFHEHHAELLAWTEKRKDMSLPMQGASDGAERRLASFLTQMQQKHRQGRLSSVEINLLRQIRGMSARIKTWDAKSKAKRACLR